MSSPDLQTAVIACPHCGTRYQVPYATIGAQGRDVSCAQCGKSWHATADVPADPEPEQDALFSADEEAGLDAAFESEAEQAASPPRTPDNPEEARTLAAIRAAIAPRPKDPASLDSARLNKARSSFAKRQALLSKRLPTARVRRAARLASFALLAVLLVGGLALRAELVRWFPSLAGLYATVGLPVNVVGLEFEDAKTLMTLRDGKSVMQITARIRSVASAVVAVPPVLVALLDEKGGVVYEWTVAPAAQDMAPHDAIDFSTEVNSPPDDTATVRLSFTDARGSAAASPAKD